MCNPFSGHISFDESDWYDDEDDVYGEEMDIGHNF
jgi:hypothetical protein